MGRLVGVLLMVVVFYGLLMASDPNAREWGNQQYLASRVGFYGILTVGVGVLIVAGGIDLSIGSVVGLGAVGFALLLREGWGPWPAALAVLGGGVLCGLCHALLVTRLGLQPFLVTLCGLFVYRGLARWLSPGSLGLVPSEHRPVLRQIEHLRAQDMIREAEVLAEAHREALAAQAAQIQDFRRLLFSGEFLGLPNQFWVLLVLAALVALLLHGTVYGRYLYAIGYNEQAARYAGIATNRLRIVPYVLCAACAGLGGVLFLLDNGTVTPTTAGTLLELYAITGAVIGGCSLRGGEGTVLGMLLGAALLPLLRQLTIFTNISSELEYVVVGLALLLGTIADQLLKRRAAART